MSKARRWRVGAGFHALILVSNIESVVIGPGREELTRGAASRAMPVQVVNHAVSLPALKSRVVELLAGEAPLEEVLEQLTQ